MTWPEDAGGEWDALLGVSLAPGPGGEANVLPFVEISAAGVSDQQYFAGGDVGPRWLNLSFLRGKVTSGTRVSFRKDRAAEPEKEGPSAVGGVNYLRRAPRSNELFFVYDQATLKPVIDAFLASWRTREKR